MKSLTLIPLGGIGNITRNMYVYEYGQQILIVDCGIGFPDAGMLGVDLLIPDISYLDDKKQRVVGMLLSHGHDDHIGGLPYILPQLGDHFPIYGSKLTVGFAKDRLKEFKVAANFKQIPDKEFNIGPFNITPIHMTHSVPDSRHFAIHTPDATVYHGSDFKLDLNPVDNVQPDFQTIAKVGQKGVDVMLSDCLNSERQLFSNSESTLFNMFEREFRRVKGKCIVTVMSSNIHRIQQAVNVAASHGRHIAFIGRSIENNVRTAVELGYLKLPQKFIINKRRIKKFKPNKLCVIIAGSQGQIGSSLNRAAEGEHTLVSINKEDKVIFASDAIPGNEENVYAAIDTISQTGADVTYSDLDDSVHVSGHSSAIEQKLLISMVKPKHLIPIGGTYHHMIQYRQLARSLRYPDNRIHLLENGQVIEISNNDVHVGSTLDLKNVMIDGLGIGDVGNVVLRDRQQMSEDGIVIIIVPVEQQTGQVRGNVEVISRGFVYVKESQDLINQIKVETANCLKGHKGYVTDWQSVRKKIDKSVGSLLYETTKRQPLIMPMVMEV